MATLDDITITPYSGILPIDALLNEGPDWNYLTPMRTTLYYTFNLAGAAEAGVSGLGIFNADQKNAVYSALNTIASITGITFAEEANADNADFHFVAGDIASSGAAGFCAYQDSWGAVADELSSYRADAYIYLDTAEYGDINTSPIPGGEGYQVLLHELGHALGLKHPFEGLYTLPEATDNTDYTLMSYTWSDPVKSTYQQYDLLALAWLYGDDGLGGASGANGDSDAAPAPLTFNPADGAVGVEVDSNIVITFTEAIQRGAGILVLKTGAGPTVETFDAATSSRLSIVGSTLTIDPTSPLANGTQYVLTLAAGTIEDLTGNGSTGTTGYDFTTVADTLAPTVVITDNLPGTARLTTASVTYSLVFSEAVTGLAVDDFIVSKGSVSSVAGSGSAWTVAVTPAPGVSSGTIGLTLAAGAVTDAAGNGNQIATNTSQAIDTVAPVAPQLVTSSAFNFLVNPQVTLDTSLGAIVIELNPEKAPRTVANLLAYVGADFYDDTLFHRVIADFMVQGGGFTTDLGYKIPLYGAIALESNNGLAHLRGTIAMARTNVADSATSQFFINQVDNPFLNYSSPSSPGYAVFGRVVSDLEVIDRIAQVATTTVGPYKDVPVTEVLISSIEQTLAGSSRTNASTLQVLGLEAGGQWSYSLDNGAHWAVGAGSSLTVPVGDYAPGAIQVRQTDAAGNVSAQTGKLTSALVVDLTAPTVAAWSPADGAAGVAVGSNIVITFSEAIERGVGDIRLATAAGTTIATYAAASSNISISASTLTIDPSLSLAGDTEYVLTFAAGTVKDLAGNPYAGTATYGFTTAPANGQALVGTGGDDQFTGNDSNDSFDGGPGIDTLILSGLPSQYQLSGSGLTGIEGADIVASIEQYRFGAWLGNDALYVSDVEAGALVDTDGAGPGVSPATALLQGISDLYIAYFNRAPDVAGLLYWFREVINGTWSLATIAQSFTDQPEYRDTYPPGLSNHDFIATIYQNLFDRLPDDAGWTYWEGDLNRGLPRDQFIYAVIQGAYAPTGGESDRTLLANKHTVSLYYSEQLALQATEEFDDNIEQVLNRVTAESQTVTQATAVIDFVFDDPITLTGLISQTEAWEAFWA